MNRVIKRVTKQKLYKNNYLEDMKPKGESKKCTSYSRKKSNGFTILEVMIALGIFSILMLAIALMLRTEIGFFNAEELQNRNEQKARTVINHTLDQVRLHGYVIFRNGESDSGFYSLDPDLESDGEPKCLVNLNPDPGGRHFNTEMFYYPDKDELWFRDIATGQRNLIADKITTLEVQEIAGASRLARIRVVAGDPASGLSYELVTWTRLY